MFSIIRYTIMVAMCLVAALVYGLVKAIDNLSSLYNEMASLATNTMPRPEVPRPDD